MMKKIDETFSITKSKGDVASLSKEIKAAESIIKQKNTYTTQSYRVFEQALAGAEKVAADKKATKSEVENALKALTNAKAALEKKIVVAKAALKKENCSSKSICKAKSW